MPGHSGTLSNKYATLSPSPVLHESCHWAVSLLSEINIVPFPYGPFASIPQQQ